MFGQIFYGTVLDYHDQVVVPALGDAANDFNTIDIARGMLDYDAKKGFYQKGTEEDFWTLVARHEK